LHFAGWKIFGFRLIRDRRNKIWHVSTGDIDPELTGQTDTVEAVAFSPDDASVAPGSYDQTIRIWNASTEGAENRLTGYHDSVESVGFRPTELT
jgi:WD40 repeat protein